MDEYKIIITPTAINNIKSIALYVAKELYNFKAAYNFLDNIEIKINDLKLFPFFHPLVKYENLRNKGLRKYNYKSFIIYFVINETKKEVQVLTVIYGKRDQYKEINKLNI